MKERLLRLLALSLIVAVATTGCIFSSDDDPADPALTVPVVTSSAPADGAIHVDPWDEITIQFNVAMDENAVEGATVLSSPDRAVVACSYSWYGTVFEIEPESDLDRDTVYTLTIGVAAVSAEGEPLASPFTMSFTTLPVHPVVLNTYPPNNATGVSLNASPWIEFSDWMNTVSVEAAISVDPVTAYTLDYSPFGADEFTIVFDSDLAASTLYTITIAASAEANSGGETLGEDYVLSFTTGSGVDTTPPEIISYSPANGATNVSRDIGQIVITFSEPIGDMPNPDGIDLRLYGLVYMEPTMDATGTVMTIPLLRLPAGVELWVDLSPFADMVGNVSADPEVYAFTTAGSPDLFPNDTDDMWLYYRQGNDGGSNWEDSHLERVENVSGANFDIARYREEIFGPRGPEENYTVLTAIDSYTLSGGVLYWNTQQEEDEGSWWSTEFNPAVEWLHFPLTMGLTWNGVSFMLIDGMDVRVTYTGEVTDIADLPFGRGFRNEQVAWRFDRAETGPVFPDCAEVTISFEVEFDDGGTWVTMEEGSEVSYYCPGVGMVFGTGNYTEHLEGGGTETRSEETRIEWWLVGQ